MKREPIVIGGIAAALLAVILAGIFLFGDSLPAEDTLADTVESGLEQVDTVIGRVTLSLGATTLEQELWVQRPHHLRSEIESGPPGFSPVGPRKTTLVLTDEEAWFYNPNLELVTVASREVELEPAARQVGTSILATLPEDVLIAIRQSEEIRVIGSEETAGREAVRVELVLDPAENDFGARTLTVWLDREFYYPLAIESDTELALRFRFVGFNRAIDPATFVFVPPPGAAVHRVGE